MLPPKWACTLVLVMSLSHLSVQQNINCKTKSDVIFVLDGSESLAEQDFNEMKRYVNKTIETNLEVEEQYARVGVIVFGTLVEEEITLNSTYNKYLLMARISSLAHPKSGTGTARALNHTRDMFARHGRPGVKKVAVVITDGKSMSPTDTKTQADLTKASGIQIIAIGFGVNVFLPELQQIASSPSMVFNSTDFDALLSSVGNTLKDLVCEVITTTTTTTTTTPIPTTATLLTQKVVSDPYCPNCILDRNTGYKSYPGDCTKFVIMEPAANNTAIETVIQCGFGLFWSPRDLTCALSVNVDCADDPCKGKVTGSAPMAGNCRTYWACVNRQSLGSCCDVGYRYDVNTEGCVADTSCVDKCPSDDDGRIQVPIECRNYPDLTDEKMYIENVPGHGNISRPCPHGTAFEVPTCSCSKVLDNPASLPLQVCEPDVYFNFDTDFKDVTGQTIAGLENMLTESKQAVFAGNSMVNMWKYSNVDFRQKLTISFEFQVQNTGAVQQALVTNCIFSDLEEATISILADRSTRSVIFTTVTNNGTASVGAPYVDNAMNKVIYVYDGTHLTGIVNGIAVQALLSGDIEKRQTGIVLGAGSQIGHLVGRMDDFRLYECWPDSVLPYVSQ